MFISRKIDIVFQIVHQEYEFYGEPIDRTNI